MPPHNLLLVGGVLFKKIYLKKMYEDFFYGDFI